MGQHDQPRTDKPQAAIVEIVENLPGCEPRDGESNIIRPNEVRINGSPLLVPLGAPIIVHGMTFNGPQGDGDELVQVTLTLFARRVFLGHASESPERSGEV